ncbi:hypothetical protein B0A48_13203 [Cryoendolithus antarcticus]|uniref:Essential protein Yae1 N-terminal domain-containing protein n=1 Tax=Cryoendolithus antarcticus TaxID=1507870 RepID=A0A1V8SP86_9PEZI|nr:hypothetical protein B0A48_13203 [Cryoendolithus antarcticus]
MLRDLPPFRANEPPFMTTPTIDEVPHQNDLLDDIFGSAPSSPVRDDADAETLEAFATQGNERSDIQRLRNTHVTNGYREGIADSKEKFIQAGFDEGYSLGAELGMKVGWCLGVLEGIYRALPTGDISAIDTGLGSDATVLVKRAREELKMQNLVTEKYFGTDGIWLFDVPGQESETTFREVAAAHPVLKVLLDHDMGGRSYQSGWPEARESSSDSDSSSLGDINMETDTDSDIEDDPQSKATNTRTAENKYDTDSDSGLSSLGSTPSPPGSPKVQNAPAEQLPPLPKCECKGWCVCKKYKLFYSGAYKGVRSVEEAESQGYKLPSQTHLNERTLAGEKLPESKMRKTARSSRERGLGEVSGHEDGKTFSWEDGEQPKRKHAQVEKLPSATSASVDTSKPTAVFTPKNPRTHTLSIALPGSIVANAVTPEQKTALCGQIARAAAVFEVDEIVVFDDGQAPKKPPEANGYTAYADPNFFLYHVLSYLETPPHLRKALFPMHPDLRTAGALPSLDMPHHLRSEEWCVYREGVAVGTDRSSSGVTSTVDCGLAQYVTVPVELEAGTRVTVKLEEQLQYDSAKELLGTAVSPDLPREEGGYYWGYSVRQASSLGAVFTECAYDGGYNISIGTSERGQPHLLVVFGGVAGLEKALSADSELLQAGVTEVKDVFDRWINLVVGQGSRTIRTEEAVWIGLTGLRSLVEARNSPV